MNNITFSQLRRYGYHHPDLIKKYQEAELTKQTNILRYIDHLASMTKTEISELKIEPFMNPNGNMVVDKTQINQIFFKLKERLASVNDAPQSIPKEKLIEAEQKISRQLVRTQQRLDATFSERVRELRRAHTKARELRGEIMDLHTSKLGLTGLIKNGLNIGKMLEDTMQMGFWSFDSVVMGSIIFISKPIRLSKFNSNQGVSLSVDMGTYMCELKMDEYGFEAKIFGHKDNINVGGCIHPHVNCGNELCYGDLREKAHEYGARMDLFGLMTCVRDVLMNYNENDSYVHLHNFQEQKEKPGRIEARSIARRPEDLGIQVDYVDEDDENLTEEAIEEGDEDPDPF